MKLPDWKTSCDIKKNGFERAETTRPGPPNFRPGPFDHDHD